MRLSTHASTGASVSVIVAHSLGARGVVPLTLAAALAAVLQYVIDAVGHSQGRRRGVVYPRRNRIHSLPGVLTLSLMVSLPALPVTGDMFTAIAAGVAASAVLHWLEDLVTEGGVYVLGKRIRVGGVPYDSHGVNLATKIVFLAMLWLYVLSVSNGFSDFANFVPALLISHAAAVRG